MLDYIKELTIGNCTVQNNVFLAPMAGVSDIPFRKICRKFHPGLTFTEMASSKAMEFDSAKTYQLLQIMEDERPSIIQIFGSQPQVIENTVKKLCEEESIDMIDINMGCPAPKLVKNGDGAGLLKDLKNIEAIVTRAVKVSSKPITVKTRRGFDEEHITAVEVAKICENAGVRMITVHGRTREEYYTGKANLDIIYQVKQNVSIPVIGNGDIVDVASAKNMFQTTQCDGIMIARGAQGNPWIFKSILEGKDYIPTPIERYEMILQHIAYAVAYEDERIANLKLRKHIAWYIKGLPDSSTIRDQVNKAESLSQVTELLQQYFKKLEERYDQTR